VIFLGYLLLHRENLNNTKKKIQEKLTIYGDENQQISRDGLVARSLLQAREGPGLHRRGETICDGKA